MGWNLWPIIQFTFWQSSVVAILSVIFGGGFAVLERYRHNTTPRWFIVLCSLPVFLPPLIVGTGFIQLLGQAGDVNTLLRWLHFPTIQFLYQPQAVILAHLYYNIPLAYLAVQATLTRISNHTEEAAQVMGAKGWQLLRTVWWPQLKTTCLGICAVIFLYCWTSFTLPLQLGGSKAKTLEVWIYEQIKLYRHSELAWAVIAIQAIVFIIPIIIVYRQLTHHTQRFVPVTTHRGSSLNSLRIMFALLLSAPLISLIMHTLWQVDQKTITTLIHSEFSSAFIRTLVLMIVTLILTILIAFLIRGQARWTLLLLTFSPVAVGLIWLSVFGQSLFSLGLALIMSLLPLTTYLLHQGRQALPTSLLEAAQILGANRWQRWQLEFRWLLPSIRQSLAIGVVLILGDVALASLLTPTDQPTVMQLTYNLLSSYHFAVGSLALVIILIIILILQTVIYYFPYARHP